MNDLTDDLLNELNEQVVLVIDSTKFLLTIDEAMQVAGVLNSCNQLTTKWISSDNRLTISEPVMTSAAITPVTAYLKIILSQNMKGSKK